MTKHKKPHRHKKLRIEIPPSPQRSPIRSPGGLSIFNQVNVCQEQKQKAEADAKAHDESRRDSVCEKLMNAIATCCAPKP